MERKRFIPSSLQIIPVKQSPFISMESKHQSCPSFLKLLMEEDFRKQIRIPNAFTRDFKKKLYRKCVLKGVPGKKSWPVRVCRKGNNFYICKRSWPKFVKDHSLKYGDYVLFLLVKKRRFEVITYGADCNRKLDVSSDVESDLSSGSDEGFESPEEEEEEEEEEDDAYEGDGDGDNDDDEDDFDPCKRQSSKNANAKDNKKSKGSRSNSGNGEKEENENDIEEEEEETDDAFGGYYRTNVKNPYFVKKLKRSHKTHMIIPCGFAKETNLNCKQTYTLHGEDERKWKVKIRITQGTVIFGEGWTRFFRGYRVKIGDTCKFTLLKSLGNVFTVEIMRE